MDSSEQINLQIMSHKAHRNVRCSACQCKKLVGLSSCVSHCSFSCFWPPAFGAFLRPSKKYSSSLHRAFAQVILFAWFSPSHVSDHPLFREAFLPCMMRQIPQYVFSEVVRSITLVAVVVLHLFDDNLMNSVAPAVSSAEGLCPCLPPILYPAPRMAGVQ